MKYYAGIGSRETPEKILRLMTTLGRILCEAGYILRSGGAPGADEAFEKLVPQEKKEIFLPWKGFNNNPSSLYTIYQKEIQIAKDVLPYYSHMKPAAQKLMSRNVKQVLGELTSDKSEFVLCYTKDGAQEREEVTNKTGGTGMAIKVAGLYAVPVYNLGKPSTLEAVLKKFNLKEYYEGL